MSDLAALTASLASAQARIAELEQTLEQAERDAVVVREGHWDEVVAERDSLRAQRDAMRGERDAEREISTAYEAERDSLRAEAERLKAQLRANQEVDGYRVLREAERGDRLKRDLDAAEDCSRDNGSEPCGECQACLTRQRDVALADVERLREECQHEAHQRDDMERQAENAAAQHAREIEERDAAIDEAAKQLEKLLNENRSLREWLTAAQFVASKRTEELAASRREIEAERARVAALQHERGDGDVWAQARGWRSVFRKCQSLGLDSFLGGDGSGTSRVVAFIDKLAASAMEKALAAPAAPPTRLVPPREPSDRQCGSGSYDAAGRFTPPTPPEFFAELEDGTSPTTGAPGYVTTSEEPRPCGFFSPYKGPCENLNCTEHASLICSRKGCGKRAVKGCDYAVSLVCGYPLCGEHQHCESHKQWDAPPAPATNDKESR